MLRYVLSYPIPPLPLPNINCLPYITGLDGRHYIIDLARAFPPESPRGVPHLSTQEYSIGQKVFATFKSKSKTTGSFQLATIVFVHDPTNPNPYVLQGERMYDVIFQVDKSLAFKVPQSKIRNGQQSIFWRLLRPEFVKHRGRSLIEKYFTGSDIHETSEGAVTHSGFEVRGSSRRNFDPLEGSVQHSIDGSNVPSSATASAHTTQFIQEEGSSKHYGQCREVGKVMGAQVSCIKRHEVPQHQQQQQQHHHHSHIKEQQAPSSSSCPSASSSGAPDTGYVSSYTVAEQLFEYQATPQSMNICDMRNQNSTYDSMYSAADEICSGASVRSEETSSGYKANSYSSSSEEYSHHYRNIYHNRNYFNYDNYMLHASSGGDSGACNRNIDDERGGIGDESYSSDGINQQQLERMTQMHMGAPHVLDAIGCGSCFTDSMGRPILSGISHPLGALQTHRPLSFSSTPSSLCLPSPSIPAPQDAYNTVKIECWNVAPEYSPSYMAAEQLFGYQATAPESTTPIAQPASALTDDKLLLNGIRNGLVRSRSEDRSTYSQVTASSSIIRALEGASNGPISDTNSSHDNNNNKTDEETSVITRMYDTPTLIWSVGASEEPWQRRGRSGSLDTASARARKRTHARLLSVSNVAMKALEGEGEASKEKIADDVAVSRGVRVTQNAATNGLLKECKGDDRDSLHHRTVDIGNQSSVMPSEDVTRSAASKDPPPLSADSLSAFSGAYVII